MCPHSQNLDKAGGVQPVDQSHYNVKGRRNFHLLYLVDDQQGLSLFRGNETFWVWLIGLRQDIKSKNLIHCNLCKELELTDSITQFFSCIDNS